MGGKVDYLRKHYNSLKNKTLQTALSQRIRTEFPRIGGPRIGELCADMILEVLEHHLRPREHVRHGQVVWTAISVDDPPRYLQHVCDVHLVPVVLDLSTPDDIDDRIDRMPAGQRLCRKAIRLCQQAYAQGGVLSNCDLAELLCVGDSQVAVALSGYEDRTGKVVPRRATIHDVGTGLTHKRIICRKRHLDGKTSQQIAQETHHTIEAVDRYLGQYDRVLHCFQQKLDPGQIAYVLHCSQRLVQEYLAIIQEIAEARR